MLNKIKLYSMVLVSIAMILMLSSIADSVPLIDISKCGNADSVIDTVVNTVTTTINAGNYPVEFALSPSGTRVYSANRLDKNGFRCKKSGSLAKSEKTFTIRKVNHFN